MTSSDSSSTPVSPLTDRAEPCVNPSAARPLVRSEGSDVRLDSA